MIAREDWEAKACYCKLTSRSTWYNRFQKVVLVALEVTYLQTPIHLCFKLQVVLELFDILNTGRACQCAIL